MATHLPDNLVAVLKRSALKRERLRKLELTIAEGVQEAYRQSESFQHAPIPLEDILLALCRMRRTVEKDRARQVLLTLPPKERRDFRDATKVVDTIFEAFYRGFRGLPEHPVSRRGGPVPRHTPEQVRRLVSKADAKIRPVRLFLWKRAKETPQRDRKRALAGLGREIANNFRSVLEQEMHPTKVPNSKWREFERGLISKAFKDHNLAYMLVGFRTGYSPKHIRRLIVRGT